MSASTMPLLTRFALYWSLLLFLACSIWAYTALCGRWQPTTQQVAQLILALVVALVLLITVALQR
jgi:hypothetical protein